MEEIKSFISRNKIASIACVDDHQAPYCFHCFYVFEPKNYLLFFKSSAKTSHSNFLLKNPCVAGSILPEKINLLALKGIQFTGSIITENYPDNINPEDYFYKKLPIALAKPGQVWCVQLEMVKMTDNTRLFGKNLRWEKPVISKI